MKLECCENGNPNVGDDLNYWLWPKLIPELLDEDSQHAFLGIGTLLTDKRINQQLAMAKTITILSSGAWGPQAPKAQPHWRIYGVRGPRTATWVGADPSKIVGDGAYLLRKFVSSGLTPQLSRPIAFVPHHRSEDFVDWATICQAAGVKLVSPRQSVNSFFEQLMSCKLVVTEAMHGAIIADALRIPWTPVKFSSSFQEDKWLDWADSMSISLDFQSLPHLVQHPLPFGKRLENQFKRFLGKSGVKRSKWGELKALPKPASPSEIGALVMAIEKVVKNDRWQLSSEQAVLNIEKLLDDAVEELISDHRRGQLQL